ncbi:triose-phosphate isomerase [Ponticaulis sp.]|uniref:triose-phosphate isomerase n=1 Tax=Ponticaulis sp. TaxID=2020902 RepID=UPI000B6F0ACD|nr:triose-phosphate isomerase [Ponticaulis sp.]MAI89422.1 triose-phosphate isomerase [Ponticaulis sp.]OUY00460.1 MAG: triose-phosphate isomerase [Hyphomonadaceae bacterium TMED5]|tara:strand:- start:67361 stop:68101 length:741 start_codon:yes stop_codon:yes gene_type:complete
MLKPLIAGNWKMNGMKSSVQELKSLIEGVKAVDDADVLICPPATLIDLFTQTATGSNVAIGAQDAHANVKGAHTGDISAEMVAEFGADYIIVGHSERRADHFESSETVQEKAKAVLAAGLKPIICIGETLEEKEAGKTLDVLGEQITGSIPPGVSGDKYVIAYEPVWAIGSGLIPEIADIDVAHSFIRNKLKDLGVSEFDKVRLLYGGSVKPGNAKEILAVSEVNGALVGGASLKASDFLGIIEAV